jgi:hypothetical protein
VSDNTSQREVGTQVAAALSVLAVWAGLAAMDGKVADWVLAIGAVVGVTWTVGVLAWLDPSIVDRLSKSRFGFLLRWFRWIRLPPFGVSYGVCTGALLAFVGWVLVDAHFPTALAVVRERLAGDYWLWDMVADDICWRIVLFAVLAGVAILSLGVVVARMFVGSTKGGRSLRTWMLAITLIAAWLGLWSSYERLQWWGVQRRVRSVLPRFQAAAAPLIEEWPTEQGTLPEAGGFYAYPVRMPNTVLLYERRGYPATETFGHEVSRTEAGGLRFDLAGGLRFDLDGAYDCKIEYHPSGARPHSHVDPFG